MSQDLTLEYGKVLAASLNAESAVISQAFGAVYNHFAPGLLTFAIPPSVVVNAVKAVISKVSVAMQDQVVSFSIPTGIIKDVLVEIEVVFPGFLKHAEDALDPRLVNALKALGIL